MLSGTILRVHDNVTFHTIKEASNACLGKVYGNFQKGKVPINEKYIAWFPQMAVKKDGKLVAGSEKQGWVNEILEDGLCIVESNESKLRKEDNADKDLDKYRLVFAKNKKEDYKFIGVYKTVSKFDKHVKHEKRTYQRIATEIDLSKLGVEAVEVLEYDFIDEVTKIKEITNTEKLAIAKCRIGQSEFRENLMKKYNGKCALCGLGYKELLIASHIKAWSVATHDERKDKENGLLLCAQHDALFDKHLITFDDDGKILISQEIEKSDYGPLNISEKDSITMSEKMRGYMKCHREVFEEIEEASEK